ncbi:MAG: methyltransferase domain-containing protein [Gemmatimonadaceae bacterium]
MTSETIHDLPFWLHRRLVCPDCKGPLEVTGPGWSCHHCARDYPLRRGIPDFRLAPDPYISIKDELGKIEKLFRGPHKSFRELLSAYYVLSPENPPSLNKHYIGAMEAAVARGRGMLARHALLFPSGSKDSLLELGCGTGGLLVSSRERFAHAVGVDVALRWILMGRERMRELGIEVPLLCANAEALPFASETFDAVLADAVLEHVRDVAAARDETLRMLKPGGAFFFVTNNRYSILAEPHLRIPAFGLLPRAVMERVAWSARKTPYKARLLSLRELRGLFGRIATIALPSYGPGELGPQNERIRRIWASLSRSGLVRAFVWPIAPQYFVSGSKTPANLARLEATPALKGRAATPKGKPH